MALDESIHRFAWEGSRNPYLIATLERYFVLSLRVWYVASIACPASARPSSTTRGCWRRSSTATPAARGRSCTST